MLYTHFTRNRSKKKGNEKQKHCFTISSIKCVEAEAEGGNNSLMSTITNRSLLSFKGPRGCTITFKFIRVDQCMHANRRLVHSSNRTVPLTIMETRVHKDEI